MTQEINLNHLTAAEYFKHKANPEYDFEQYRQDVIYLLMLKDKFLFENDILNSYKEDGYLKGKTMEEIIAAHPDKFIAAGNKRKDENSEWMRTWYDIWEDYHISPKDQIYDLFLVYQIRNTDILAIDEFLNYQLEKYFEGDAQKFKRFVLLAIRKHGNKLLKLEQTETVDEWMTSTPTKTELSGAELSRNKGKLKREAGDKMTCLNLEQTALLIYFLQEGKIILKDEYLPKKQAGLAFNILTGFSADTLRQELGLNGIGTEISRENIKELHNAIVRLEVLIHNRIRNK